MGAAQKEQYTSASKYRKMGQLQYFDDCVINGVRTPVSSPDAKERTLDDITADVTRCIECRW